MNTYVRLPLRLKSGKRLYYNKIILSKYQKEIINFLEGEDYFNSLDFAKKALLLEEIKANNNIEGINDDLLMIENVIKNKKNIPRKQKERIINLYKGYNYILKSKVINKDNLKILYDILSKGLLDDYSAQNMGDYYRTKPVYILNSRKLDIYTYKGIKEDRLEYYMNKLFDYINEENNNNEFIKSQIIHFYFVYVHPYFDVNGRTARTVSMWHLLNKKCYPYIIFNRAISFNKRKYEKKIINARSNGDITLFLKYMLKEVKKELEKELLIQNISDNLDGNLSREEAQILEYALSIKGDITLKSLNTKYNAYNVFKKEDDFIDQDIKPLINKKIIYLDSNRQLKLSADLISSKSKIKRLKSSKFIKN